MPISTDYKKKYKEPRECVAVLKSTHSLGSLYFSCFELILSAINKSMYL